ncbi:MAG: LPS export ABC transporter permease LptG [Acetobacteraceae bacterium]|nr:LPS export ABC transporter permease LptG [Acetobacteraceae bacterium]
MPFATTLTLYIARVFSVHMLGMLAALTGVVSLFDLIELLRRAATRPDATFAVVAQIAGLRLPWAMMQILPFAVLLGGILAFWRLTRSSELIVARATGMSAWQFLAGPTLCAVGLGCFAVAVVTPVSAAMRARAEALDSNYIKSGGGPMALNGGQLWLRQADHELDSQGVALLHANHVVVRDGTLAAFGLSIFRLDAEDRLLERIEAVSALLTPGNWVLNEARTIVPGRHPTAARDVSMPTSMTVDRVQDSFAPPDTLSIWALPGFIALLDRSGFSSIRHRLHFHSLLAMPLLAGTMSLVAAGFSMRPARRGGVAQMIGSGVAAGFALFVIAKVAEEFGQTGTLPPALAAWAPIGAGLMLSVSLLLHLEDG